MWGYDIIIVCGMTMVGLIVSAFIGMIILSTAVAPQRDVVAYPSDQRESESSRLFPWPIR